MTEAWVVLCTCPDQTSAERLAKQLLTQGLAACVNLLPKVRSLYLWQGQLCDDQEVQMIIKTTRQRYPALEAALSAAHPYDNPEILALAAADGAKAYLSWLSEVTHD
ncbi:divalent-cation tolerance protein CutA [Gallaecimonas pentaromativorans]|uniref:divalent-cation tolerance protein CutA n=1 Tax=Gallaecimonas pentaromativorans TaxID=584787 RepID=UPI003A9472AB